MKRIIGLVCVIGALASTSFAQGIYVGPAIGYGSSQTSVSIAGQSLDDVEGGSGPSFGGFIGKWVNPAVAVEAGVFYGGESFKVSSTFPVPTTALGKSGASDSLKTEVTFNYVNIPVVVMGQFPEEGNIKARVRGGIQLGFEAGCTIETPNIVSPASSTTKQDCSEGTGTKTKSTNLSVPLSIGAGIALGDMQLFLDVGYKLGLTNVADNPSDDQATIIPDVSIKHNGIFGTVGLAIPIGG